MKEINFINPFKRFITTIGILPSSYTESMSYYEQLVWLCNYLENTVIPAVNNNALATEELQKLFTELKGYIDDYFKNLDVQQEVNNKLDNMVSDGTFNRILNEELLEEINSKVENININKVNKSEFLENIRKEYNNYFNEIKMPNSFNSDFFKNIKIYDNGYRYVYDIDINKFKNNSNNIYYVSPNGNDSNSGLNRNEPLASIQTAYSKTISGDTIYCLSGIYSRKNAFQLSNPSIKRSINLIGEGEVILTQGDFLDWTQNDTYPNIYQANRTNIYEVIDITNISNNSTNKLKSVGSLEACNSEEGSFYYTGSIIYVHMFNNKIPNKNNIDCALILGDAPLKIDELTENATIYIENIKIVDGYKSCIVARNYNNFIPTIILNNCVFLNQKNVTSVNQDSVCMQGVNSIIKGCISSFSEKDGFNYHALNGIICNSIEIDNIGSYAGLNRSDNSYNGSTAHDGCKILRINCIYHNNKGPNVADVQNNTESINFGIISYDSNADKTLDENSDFFTSQGNSKMYLYRSYSKYSKSIKNLVALDNSIIYNINSLFDTSKGNIINN